MFGATRCGRRPDRPVAAESRTSIDEPPRPPVSPANRRAGPPGLRQASSPWAPSLHLSAEDPTLVVRPATAVWANTPLEVLRTGLGTRTPRRSDDW